MTEKIHGYKVFKPDWTCRDKQYTCPGKFEEKGKLSLCNHGMHFCENAADCFNYYEFDCDNKVAEVIAYGTVLKEGDKSCTDKLEIVREIPWDELLRIINEGKSNTGRGNTGNCNTGNWNTGNKNTGNWNAGDWNAGNGNTGKWNTGDCNTGDCNTGAHNTGDCNTGDRNTGCCNTGDYNTGRYNTGNGNTGNWNTGDWNKSSFNTGCFNTREQKLIMFNKPSDWTHETWFHSDARYLLSQMPMQKNAVEWICSKDMTAEEKTAYPTYKTTGGYLKTLSETESAQLWWNSLSEEDKQKIYDIPNFDAEIFKVCTGIDVNATED